MTAHDFGGLEREITRLWQRLERVERGAPAGFTSVSRGAFTINSPEGLIVVGSARIDGILRGENDSLFHWEGRITGTGKIEWTGGVRLDGDVEITKTLDVSAATKLRGTLDVTGATTLSALTTLLSDLVVSGGGKIIAGSTFIYPDGRIVSGSQLELIGSTGILLGGTVTAAGGFRSAYSFRLTDAPTMTASANVYIDPTTGQFFRATSASRYKIDAQPLVLSPELLDIPVKDWLDAGQVELAQEIEAAPRPLTEQQTAAAEALTIRRIPGVIAEEVEAAGGEAFVEFGAGGVVEGVAYDRLAMARTQLLLQRLKDAEARITTLEAKLATVLP